MPRDQQFARATAQGQPRVATDLLVGDLDLSAVDPARTLAHVMLY